MTHHEDRQQREMKHNYNGFSQKHWAMNTRALRPLWPSIFRIKLMMISGSWKLKAKHRKPAKSRRV